MKKYIIGLFLLITIQTNSQVNDTIDYTKEIISHDISNLLTLTEFNYSISNELVKRTEPLGYIGENYQRFYIHFISVIKNINTSTKYYVYGKSKVKNNTCEFQGVLTVDNAILFPDFEFPTIEQGVVNGKYKFYENSNQNGSGIFEGMFQTDFYIDKQGEIKYDALMFSADIFYNNMFKGTWTSYKTGKSKKCNWGDYRIPESGDLDIGAGEFGPNSEYSKFGWENYINAYYYGSNKPKAKKAIEKLKKRIGGLSENKI